ASWRAGRRAQAERAPRGRAPGGTTRLRPVPAARRASLRAAACWQLPISSFRRLDLSSHHLAPPALPQQDLARCHAARRCEPDAQNQSPDRHSTVVAAAVSLDDELLGGQYRRRERAVVVVEEGH